MPFTPGATEFRLDAFSSKPEIVACLSNLGVSRHPVLTLLHMLGFPAAGP